MRASAYATIDGRYITYHRSTAEIRYLPIIISLSEKKYYIIIFIVRENEPRCRVIVNTRTYS
jgi:hypothetical protein